MQQQQGAWQAHSSRQHLGYVQLSHWIIQACTVYYSTVYYSIHICTSQQSHLADCSMPVGPEVSRTTGSVS
jgi:hypothetical protein